VNEKSAGVVKKHTKLSPVLGKEKKNWIGRAKRIEGEGFISQTKKRLVNKRKVGQEQCQGDRPKIKTQPGYRGYKRKGEMKKCYVQSVIVISWWEDWKWKNASSPAKTAL